MTNKFTDYLSEYNIKLSNSQLDLFDKYSELLISYNKTTNLTAITEPEQIAVKHFFDSLLVLNSIDIPTQSKLIDVGTGAGFPSVPIKIARPDIELTLVDSLNKRIQFLIQLMNVINLKSEIIHSRAEDLARKEQYRDSFDFVTSRAVSKMNLLSEYCLPYLKVGGCFVAMKGQNIDEELKQSKNAISILGGEIVDVKNYRLDYGERNIVIVQKRKETNFKYPRNSAKIKKLPL